MKITILGYNNNYSIAKKYSSFYSIAIKIVLKPIIMRWNQKFETLKNLHNKLINNKV